MFTIDYKIWNDNEFIISAPFVTPDKEDKELSGFEVDGSGNIEIRNTGGSSAAEGGMGDRGGSEKGPGILQTDGETKTNDNNNESFDKKFDPLAPKEDKSNEKDS